jgi:hypothetical protein
MRMKFADYRQFEMDRAASAEDSLEDATKARADLRAIVRRMRGDFQSETPAAKQA